MESVNFRLFMHLMYLKEIQLTKVHLLMEGINSIVQIYISREIMSRPF